MTNLAINQHVVPTCRAGGKLVVVDVEERVHRHAAGADVN
jgi:hypothetical protein